MKLIIVPVKPLEQYIYTKPVNTVIDDNLSPVTHNCNAPSSRNQFDAEVIKVSIKPKNVIPVKLVSVPSSVVSSDVDYNELKNIPSLNGVKIIGEKKSIDFGIQNIEPLSNMDLELLLK